MFDPVNLILLLLGNLMNLLGALAEASQEDRPVHPWKWIKARPYRVLLGVSTSLAVYLLVDQGLNQMDAINAFLAGYAADNVMGRIADARANKVASKV